MSYRRENNVNEQIPLPVETIYNSVADSLKTSDKYYHENDKYFNRLYFNYPPEWKTSNIGEKIIGVRDMSIQWREGELNFVLYIRKYNHDKFDEVNIEIDEQICEALNDNTVEYDFEDQTIIDNMDLVDVMVFEIPIHIKISSNDNWIDIKDQIRKAIDDENIYNYLKRRINERTLAIDQRLDLLRQLEDIKGNYESMIFKSNELIGEKLSFYLKSSDVDIIDEFRNGEHLFRLCPSTELDYDSTYWQLEFLITNTFYDTYRKFFPNIEGFKRPSPYSYNISNNRIDKLIEWVLKQENGDTNNNDNEEEEEDRVYEPKLNDRDKFDPYTANFFNLGNDNPHRNKLQYVTMFHEYLELKNLMTNLNCEVAASFASQSNHNLIGRANENFVPIKYYKLNDHGDSFWIEFYDRNEIDVPLAINSNVVFTMDVVFLQNRKLLYS